MFDCPETENFFSFAYLDVHSGCRIYYLLVIQLQLRTCQCFPTDIRNCWFSLKSNPAHWKDSTVHSLSKHWRLRVLCQTMHSRSQHDSISNSAYTKKTKMRGFGGIERFARNGSFTIASKYSIVNERWACSRVPCEFDEERCWINSWVMSLIHGSSRIRDFDSESKIRGKYHKYSGEMLMRKRE